MCVPFLGSSVSVRLLILFFFIFLFLLRKCKVTTCRRFYDFYGGRTHTGRLINHLTDEPPKAGQMKKKQRWKKCCKCFFANGRRTRSAVAYDGGAPQTKNNKWTIMKRLRWKRVTRLFYAVSHLIAPTMSNKQLTRGAYNEWPKVFRNGRTIAVGTVS